MRELNTKEVCQVSGGKFDFCGALDGIQKQIDGFLKDTITGITNVFDGLSKLVVNGLEGIKDALADIFAKKP